MDYRMIVFGCCAVRFARKTKWYLERKMYLVGYSLMNCTQSVVNL